MKTIYDIILHKSIRIYANFRRGSELIDNGQWLMVNG
jgi:hypothetical protein